MPALVTSDHADIVCHLRGPRWTRLAVEHAAVSSVTAALEAIARLRPSAALIHADLAGGGGLALARQIKDDPTLRHTRVILAVGGDDDAATTITPALLRDLAPSGCHDILALPIPHDEFYDHLTAIAEIARADDQPDGDSAPASDSDSEPVSEDVASAAATSSRGVHIALRGDFTEHTTFASLEARLADADPIDFDAGGIRYMSSVGVRAWCAFLATLGGKRYAFRRCSVSFLSQAALVPMVTGDGRVHSLMAPYVCETCDREDTLLLDTRVVHRDHGRVQVPQLACGVCGDALEFDDIPERYLAFLLNAPAR